MQCLGVGSASIVVDKGCLDCFVSGGGEGSVGTYLRQVGRVLRPDGRFVLVPVNGADIVHLLKTGQCVRDKRASGNSGHAAFKSWSKTKMEGTALKDSGAGLFQVESIWAYQEKHAYVCKLAASGEATGPHLTL